MPVIDNVSLPATSDPAVNQRRVQDALDKLISEINAALADPASDTVAGLIEIAVQSELEAATNTLLAVTPGRMRFHPGVAKFWAVVTVSGGTHTLAASYNVTSITDGATGIHTVTIATDFSSANWCCSTSAQGAGTTVGNVRIAAHSSKAAGSVVISTYGEIAGTLNPADATSVSTVGFGDHV